MLFAVRFFALLCFSLVTMAASVRAADRNVYPGFIVTMKGSRNAAISADSGLSQRGLSVSKDLGRNQLLVTSGGANFAADAHVETVVPYNPEQDICPQLLSSGAVESCSPNYEVRINALPNDPSFSSLWGMSSTTGIDASAAWDLTTGSEDVVVAVIDTGVDYTHPDLASNMWRNPLEVAGNGIDDDRNGIVDDIYGANFSHGDGLAKGDPRDNNMHGTHVAGTIGAIGNNSRGVVGVNWNVKIMALKFLNSQGSGSLADAVSAINYVIAMKARGVNVRVANNSWGGGGYTAALFNAIAATRDAGIIFVAAAGNEANDNDANASYPASYDLSNVVSVAAIDINQNLASFSNYGQTQVDIAAPGVGILSTTPGNTYGSLSGTSMATPHVTGALALLLSREPDLSNDQALARMYDSGVPLNTLNGVVRTARKLSVNRMVNNITEPIAPPTPLPLPCHYAMSEIAFNPDQSVANEPIALQADELNFLAVDMPFTFPFYRTEVSSIQVSPNGVVYTGKTPNAMDFVNRPTAPLRSIAPLQSDLFAAEGTTDGIHISKQSDRVIVYWDQKSYEMRDGANVKVWLHLYSSGVVEQFISFGSNALMKKVQAAATIGMSGPTKESSDTFAVNNKNIRNGLALRYTPQCDGDGATENAQVRRIKVVNQNGELAPGKKVGIHVGGSGYGTVLVGAAFNDQVCQGQVPGYMTDGRLRMQARLPRREFNRFSVIADGKQARMRVSNSSGRAPRSKRINSARLESLCNVFFATLK